MKNEKSEGLLTNYLLDLALNKLTDWNNKRRDLDILKDPTWTYKFHSYLEAKSFLDSMKTRYSNDDYEMKYAISNADIHAQIYFRIY